MTARSHYEPEAGPWVAYRDRPDGRRDYVWNVDSDGHVLGWQVGGPNTCVRFDTRAEALAAMELHPRVRGWRKGAEPITPATPAIPTATRRSTDR